MSLVVLLSFAAAAAITATTCTLQANGWMIHPSEKLASASRSSKFQVHRRLAASHSLLFNTNDPTIDQKSTSNAAAPAPIPQPQPPRLIVLIPAYNEESRIRSTLISYTNFLQKFHADLKPQIWVVDDGSTDSTMDVVESFSSTVKHGHSIGDGSSTSDEHIKIDVRCIPMKRNGGKGAALAKGVSTLAEEELHARENDKINNNNIICSDVIILTQDADGSGDLIYLQSMLEKLMVLLGRGHYEGKNNNHDTSSFWLKPAVVVGNRNYNIFSSRGITRWGFRTVVKTIMNDLRVSDSQCGYKLMTLPAATMMYNNLNLQGWSHDVEVLYKAKLYDIPIDEISIDWYDQDGSKLVESGVVRVSLKMLWDVLRLRINHSVTRRWNFDR
jgi:dolichyl-phosphate beta-glucosyltransferase